MLYTGYTEIEYRLTKVGMQQLPLYSKQGSIERLKEFIRFLVSSSGSVELFKTAAQLDHIAPQIGTLHLANDIEQQKLRIFRLENFDSEWKRLSNVSGFPELQTIYESLRMVSHASAGDSLRTKQISRLYFNDYFDSRHNSYNNSKLSATYFRALCRIYLVDFICSDYILPPVCADLKFELERLILEFKKHQALANSRRLQFKMFGISLSISPAANSIYPVDNFSVSS